MSCRCAPSLLLLQAELNTAFPDRQRGAGSSDGCCGDARHAATKSDHNPDASGYAHALDVDDDLDGNTADKAGEAWYLCPILLADPRTKYVIYERWIYYPGSPPKRYTGVDPHTSHIHLSIKPNAHADLRPWNIKENPPMPADVAQLLAAARDIEQTTESLVALWYANYLGRNPDPAGAAYWYGRLQTIPAKDVRAEFLALVPLAK